jgi:hypothetical protein
MSITEVKESPPVMRRAFTETLMSAGAVMLLLIALVCIDDRLREQVTQRVMSHPTAELATQGKLAGDLTSEVVLAARGQAAAHKPFVLFALVAGVLVVFMLRT